MRSKFLLLVANSVTYVEVSVCTHRSQYISPCYLDVFGCDFGQVRVITTSYNDLNIFDKSLVFS